MPQLEELILRNSDVNASIILKQLMDHQHLKKLDISGNITFTKTDAKGPSKIVFLFFFLILFWFNTFCAKIFIFISDYYRSLC